MNISEKFYGHKEIFDNYFLSKDKDPYHNGTWIPAAKVTFDERNNSKRVEIGDGTINLSYLMTYYLLSDSQTNYSNCLHALYRLVHNADIACRMKWNIVNIFEPGFFVRDDISSSDIDSWNTLKIHSGWSSSIEGIDEDPCFSVFISQDQVWNLIPPIVFSKKTVLKDSMFLINVLYFIIENNHTIYNPYYSRLHHIWTYVPTFNEDKLKPWDRVEDRNKHFKNTIKVKRGANNWYFAYGFRKVYEKISGNKLPKFKNFLYSLIYYPLIFLADKVYYPLFGKWVKVKETSYYNIAMASGVWYNKKFWKRVVRKFNKDGSHWEIVPLMVYQDKERIKDIDLINLRLRLEDYPEPKKEGDVNSPIDYMIQYKLFEYVNNQLS